MIHHHYREIKFLMRGERLRDFVFGYNDGAVTTLAVIAALVAASSEALLILLAALANIFGSGISFALGDFISIKSQIDFFKTFKKEKNFNKQEREEVKDMAMQFDHPAKIAGIALSAFIMAGLISLTPFLFLDAKSAFSISIIVTFGGVFTVGMLRARYTHGNIVRSGTEMLIIAVLALSAAYFIGSYGIKILSGI